MFIDFVLEKSLTNLPYALLQIVSLIKTDIPEGAHLSVMFAFIVMEIFSALFSLCLGRCGIEISTRLNTKYPWVHCVSIICRRFHEWTVFISIDPNVFVKRWRLVIKTISVNKQWMYHFGKKNNNTFFQGQATIRTLGNMWIHTHDCIFWTHDSWQLGLLFTQKRRHLTTVSCL